MAGTSAPTISASLGRLEEAGWVERRRERRRKAQEIGQLLRLRWGRSRYAALAHVGKSCGLLAHYLFAARTDGLSTADLADITGRRRDDVRSNLRSNLRGLASGGLAVEVSSDHYALPADFWKRLDRELEDSGITTSERLNQQREHRVVDAAAYWEKQPKPAENEPLPGPANSPHELFVVPTNLVPPDGEIEELERVADMDEWDRRFAQFEYAAQEVNSRRTPVLLYA